MSPHVVPALSSKQLVEACGGKGLYVPKDGWRASSFAAHGGPMIVTLHRLAVITQRRQGAIVARRAKEIFRKQIDRVLDRFIAAGHFATHPRAAAAPDLKQIETQVMVGAHESLLSRLLNEELAATRNDVTTELVPPVQSTMAQGYSKTSVLLAQQPDESRNPGLARRARGIAERISNISETTRTRFETMLRAAVENGDTVGDTIRNIREQFPEMQANRAVLIARSETNNAWTEGSAQAFKESSTITKVSVIGCQSRETDRWGSPSYQRFMYRGESTCNIQDVPVADADKLEFHPNHTGTMVPSAFID